VARETRSRIFTVSDQDVRAEYVVEWNDVDGQSVTVGITPLHASEALREFTRLPGITNGKAMLLFDAGYKTVAALRAASAAELGAVEGLDPGDASRVADALAAPEPTWVACPACGVLLPKDARRCLRCGEAVTTETLTCSRCGAPIPPGDDACPVCGLSLATGSKAPAGPSRVACVACGEFILAGSEVCPSCGARQKAPAARAEPGQPAVAGGPGALGESSTYLVEEEQPREVYRLFGDAIAKGRHGLCVSRLYPQKLRERFPGADLTILWLSNVGKEDAIRPKDLEKLSLAVEQFLAREPGVVLLDGIEYLVTNNNFLTVLRLVQALRDQVAINRGILLLSVSPSALEGHQLTLLEREVDRVTGSTSAAAP
jgi:RNA polymerase subunit RPABC4/transcription elongation factor Spt4